MKDIKFINKHRNEHIQILNYVDGKGEIQIQGDIGEGFFTDGYTFTDFQNDISMIKGDITINIGSYGGDLMDGLAIHDYIRSLDRKVTTKMVKSSASAGTLIHIAGDTRLISKGSKYLIHKPLIGAMGNSDDFQKILNQLKEFDRNIVELYTSKTGLSEEEVLNLMVEERWMNADEAVEKGFCDGYIEEKDIKNNTNKMENVQNKIEEEKVIITSEDIVQNKVQEQEFKMEKDEEMENLKAKLKEQEEEIKDLKAKLEEKEKQDEEKNAKNIINSTIQNGKIKEDSFEKFMNIYKSSGLSILNEVINSLPDPVIVEKTISKEIEKSVTPITNKQDIVNKWKKGEIDTETYLDLIK